MGIHKLEIHILQDCPTKTNTWRTKPNAISEDFVGAALVPYNDIKNCHDKHKSKLLT